MRYMGRIGDTAAPVVVPGFDNPVARAQMLALAPMVDDATASALADFVDATKFGEKQKLTRIGLGAAAGLVIGGVIGWIAKKK